MLENHLYEDLEPGQSIRFTRVCTLDDFYVFARASGNLNPLHLAGEDGDGDGRPEAFAPSIWLASLISAALGNRLPGPGTRYLAQDLVFHGQAQAGDALGVEVTVREKRPEREVVFDTRVTRGAELLVSGTARVEAPLRKIRFDPAHVPELILERHCHTDRLLAAAHGLAPLPTAVVAPGSEAALSGALDAAHEGLIAPVLVGDPDRIRAASGGTDPEGVEIVAAGDPAEAAARAVELVREGRAQAIMKGDLHTDTLLHPIVTARALRGPRRLSHIYAMDVPGLSRPLLVSDAAINIAPNLEVKVDIVQNAIDLARALGIVEPRVGVLSAVETVNPAIPSTIDAAVLSKMAERGQITGGLVDGPLAMDNAIDLEAARSKHIESMVAGRADVLIAPNLEAANMLAKELTFAAHAEAGGLVLGAKVPVMLTSRAESARARLLSAAMAVLYVHWRETGESAVREEAAAPA